MQTIKCCLVGYGGIAEHHSEALAQIDGVCFHTLVGRREAPTKAFAEEKGFENWTTDYTKAVEDPDVDAVVIASPSEVHFEQATRALEAGKDVLVEIPLALSHRGARDLTGCVRKAGRRLMVAHTRRYDPAGRFVRDFIASGKSGQVYQHHQHSLWHRHENVGWSGYRRSWVDDVLFHHGCHLVDYSLWTIGSPVRRVRGELSPLHPVTGTSMDVSLTIRYTNEAMATVSLSYNAPKPSHMNLFVCEAGSLVQKGRTVVLNDETIFEANGDVERSIVTQDREFIHAVRENRQPTCSVEDGLQALAVLQQVYDQMVTMEGVEKYRRRWGL